MEKVTVASLNSAFQNIQAFDMFRKRADVIDAVETEVKQNMQKLGFTVTRLNIMNVDVPSVFYSAVKKTQIVK